MNTRDALMARECSGSESIGMRKLLEPWSGSSRRLECSYGSCGWFSKRRGLIQNLWNWKSLRGHRGCINTINWSQDGRFLVTGSDDLTFRIWSTASFKQVSSYESGHSNNIFCSKFVPDTGNQKVVTCAADGVVHYHAIEGNKVTSRKIKSIASGEYFQKLAFKPDASHVMLVTATDGRVQQADLREKSTRRLLVLDDDPTDLAFDPCNPNHFALGTSGNFVKMFDIRNCSKESDSFRSFLPGLDAFVRGGPSGLDISSDGELVANYMDGDVYLFNLRSPHMEDEINTGLNMSIVQRYTGAKNAKTCMKEVRFAFREEYVVSGSDCGRFFVWEKKTGRTVRAARADRFVVNCVAPHPDLPILAVSGIDSHAKIFLCSFGENSKGIYDLPGLRSLFF